MKVLGIDPGSRITGWGLVASDGWDLSFVAHGAIRCENGGDLAGRLLTIATGLEIVIEEHSPDFVAVEQVFSSKNARSALILGQARGVALLAAARAGLPLFEYSASQVKSAVTGYGRADKKQIQQAVATQLALRELPRPQDAADALAIAICHSAAARLSARLDAQASRTKSAESIA